MPKIEAQLFQIPVVKLDGQAVSFPFKRVDALFYYLLCKKTATRQELVDLLWADGPEEVGYKNLRHTIYTLRKILGADVVVTALKTEVRLNPEREIVCDFDQRPLRETADEEQFLRGFSVKNAPNFNSWVDRVREQISNHALSDLSAEAAEALRRGDLQEAERLGLDYLSRDGLDEKMGMFLMRLYRQDGRYYKAAALYQRLKGRLAEELGVAPLHETAELYYDIVNQWNQTTEDDGARPAPQMTGSRGILLQTIRDRCRRFLEGYPAPSLLFYGEAGCGKSYLLQSFLRGAELGDALVLTGNCSQREAGGYLEPWKNVMLAVAEEILRRGLQLPETTRRTIARVFPVFSDGMEEPREPSEAKPGRCGPLVAEAAALALRLAADRRKLLLVFEDLQWMDPAGQDLLCQVMRRLGGSQLLLLATSWTLNVDMNFWLDETALERIHVPCLTEEETGKFLEEALGREVSAGLRARMFEATEGNPRLLADAAENLRDKEDALPDPNSILRRRLTGLSEPALRLAKVLALFPEGAPCGLLSELTGFQAERLYPLSVELEEHSLVRETCVDGESCLSFLHPHMRDGLYQMQSYFQRQPLHLRIADFLENNLSRMDGYLPLAYHCREGGDGPRALRCEVEALLWNARRRYELPPLTWPEEGADGCLPKGVTAEEFEQTLERELERLRRRRPEDAELDRLDRRLRSARARRLIYTGRYQEGLALTDRLIGELTPCPDECALELCHILRPRIAYGLQTDQMDPEDILRGLELAKRAGGRERAYFLMLRGVELCKRGEYDDSGYYLNLALETLERTQDRHPAFSAYVWTWLGEGKRRQKDFAAACGFYEKAEDLSAGTAAFPGLGFLRACHGRAVMALGDEAKAEALFCAAMEAYAATGELPGRCLAQAYAAYYAAMARRYDQAAGLLAESWESASQQSSLVEQGIRDSVLARLRRELDRAEAADNALHRYLYRPLDIYCHRGLQRLRGVKGAYEAQELEQYLGESRRHARPLGVENLYSKNKNFMTE